MVSEVLDIRKENGSVCYLTKMPLSEYVSNLPLDYQNFEIQREIVSNVYLDGLVDTVLAKRHIPPIVLVASRHMEEDNKLTVNEFKILDGLQRTYRLNAIWRTIKMLENENFDHESVSKINNFALSRQYSKKLNDIGADINILNSLLVHLRNSPSLTLTELVLNSFIENFQWFEIWANLTPKQEVDKMLTLNAGHKPVKIKHQLEIIFMNIYPLLQDIGGKSFDVIREKESPSISFSKKRMHGQFHFAHLISSLLSLREGKPVTTNSDLVQKLQNQDFQNNDNKYFNFEFLEEYIKSLIKIESRIEAFFPNDDLGTRWIGREVSLTGIYGAIGHKLNESKHSSFINRFDDLVDQLVANIKYLNLEEYERVRNSQELSKVNIGSANKNAIWRAVLDLLSRDFTENINWTDIF